MSGLAPITVFLTAGLIAALGLAWIIAALCQAQAVAKCLAIVFASAAAVCAGFLVIDKMINVSYAKGLYAAIAVMLGIGIAAGFALGRVRP